MGDDRNHFKFLNKATAKISSLLERIRTASSAFYIALQIIFFLLLGIATYFIEQACEKGWAMILLLALFGILFLLAVFAFDYANAKRINHQFFWKPWILILILILNIMFLGLRIGGQRTENARQLQETNDFYADITRNLSNRIDVITSENVAKIGRLNDSISDLKGQLADAKADRDKYQLLLAPFQAAALKIYTNAPLDQRLEIFAETLNIVTNELASDKPIIHLEINGTKPMSLESPKEGENVQLTPILINTNKQIALAIFNDSEITAEHITVDFSADTDPTNVIADQWTLEPKNPKGMNHWHLVATDSYGALGAWTPQTISISQNFKQQSLSGQFMIHADRSKSWAYFVLFTFQN